MPKTRNQLMDITTETNASLGLVRSRYEKTSFRIKCYVLVHVLLPFASAFARRSANGETSGGILPADGWRFRGDRALGWNQSDARAQIAARRPDSNRGGAEAQLPWRAGGDIPHSFLVNTGTKLVLIDAGAGTLLGPATGDLLNNIRAAGYRPEEVDEIISHICTWITLAVR